MAAAMVGFDTESKPTFAVGEVSTGPHIVQFATHNKAFIFQLCHSDCRAYLTEILQSHDVQKIGFGLESDRTQIYKKLGLTVNALVDLNTVFRKQGYARTAGVRAAVAIVLNQKFHKSKRVTTTNWSRPQLSPAQMLYAANDAYAALKVMERLALLKHALDIHD
jgi:ribonuclease D